MTTTNVNIRMDADIKRQADELFSELGLNMSTAINMFVRRAIRARGIPFDIVIPEHQKILLEADAEITEMLKNPQRTQYSSAEELHAAILSED